MAVVNVTMNRLPRYFGLYPHYNEINEVLQGIKEKYDLGAKSFAARHGSGSSTEYRKCFNTALDEVLDASGPGLKAALPMMRSRFEEATLLFDSKYNACWDVVPVGCDSQFLFSSFAKD